METIGNTVREDARLLFPRTEKRLSRGERISRQLLFRGCLQPIAFPSLLAAHRAKIDSRCIPACLFNARSCRSSSRALSSSYRIVRRIVYSFIYLSYSNYSRTKRKKKKISSVLFFARRWCKRPWTKRWKAGPASP